MKIYYVVSVKDPDTQHTEQCPHQHPTELSARICAGSYLNKNSKLCVVIVRTVDQTGPRNSD
jgi:hypothetical protein